MEEFGGGALNSIVNSPLVTEGLGPAAGPRNVSRAPTAEDISLAFEKMLWAEMLSHAGLEKALTQSGGEGASAFSRMLVESIAEDLARRHSFNLNPYGSAGPARPQAEVTGGMDVEPE